MGVVVHKSFISFKSFARKRLFSRFQTTLPTRRAAQQYGETNEGTHGGVYEQQQNIWQREKAIEMGSPLQKEIVPDSL